MHHPNPNHPLSPQERFAYSERHSILGFPLETGSGHGTPDQQAENYCKGVDATEGREAGNAMRREAGLPVAEDIAAAAAKTEQDRATREAAAFAALAENPALEAEIVALKNDLATIHAASGGPPPAVH